MWEEGDVDEAQEYDNMVVRQCCAHGQQFTTSAHWVEDNEEGVTAIVED
jgi:hypothetical protein